jgi:hypothetical protein
MSGKVLLPFFVVVLLLCTNCIQRVSVNSEVDSPIYLESLNDSLHKIVLVQQSDTNKWELPYPVFQFVTGDIDGDGTEDIMVGVVKPTRFHPIKAKRLFVFKNFDGYVRPMWLGSMMSQPLIDFWLIKNELGFFNIITFEREKSGKMLVAEYRWDGFGLKFLTYHLREVRFR